MRYIEFVFFYSAYLIAWLHVVVAETMAVYRKEHITFHLSSIWDLCRHLSGASYVIWLGRYQTVKDEC